MSYLQPPPNMTPVVVVKDFGGYVNEYADRTEEYRRTNREVRIHECHSACTMALSLPNVCVYPDSVFKFHQAYDPRNHITNWQVSGELFNTYPVAVRERLGTLTKQFTILRGDELIDLGVRKCGEPQPRIMVAKATVNNPTVNPMTSSSNSTLAMLTGRLQGIIPSFGTQPEPATPGRSGPRRRPVVPDEMLQAKIPLPPEKPSEFSDSQTASIPPDAVPAPEGTPLPPPRPKQFLVAYAPGLPPMPMIQMIDGSQKILPAHFVPFPKKAG